MSKKLIGLLLVVIAVVGLGVVAVSAQDTGTDTWPPFGTMGRGGYGGMMGLGPHMMWDGDTAPMFSAIADALGIDPQTLTTELQTKTLAQLAQEKGIDLTALQAAVQTQLQTQLQAMVQAGTITQAQADAHLSFMQAHWDDMPMFGGQGFGVMGGGQWGTGSPRGMMGRGR